MAALGCTFATVSLVALGGIVYGFTVAQLWEWFIVPVFHLPLLRIPQAVGIGILVGLMTKEYNEEKERDAAETLIRGFLIVFIVNGAALLSGYIWSRFL